MPSQRRIEANRRNAQKSTGPKSVAGKAVSSLNAIKTGIHGRIRILPSENKADLRKLTAAYYAHFRPTTPETRTHVNSLIQCEWLFRRYHGEEIQLHRRFETTLHTFRHALESIDQLQGKPAINYEQPERLHLLN
jgi:hypothetical protein